MTVLVPDVSEFQSPASGNAPNWSLIKDQNGGAAIIRVGYGNDHLDRMLVSNRSTIKSLNYTFCGLYQYLRADQDPVTQAGMFINWIGTDLNKGEIPILDLEEGSGNQSLRAEIWFGIIDAFYGLDQLPLNQRSWLYSYAVFVSDHNLGGIFASPRRTWIAAYQSTEPTIGHTLWQSTDGQFGVNVLSWRGCGRVDTSIYHAHLPTLTTMGSQPTSPTPSLPTTSKKELNILTIKVPAPAGHVWTGTRTFLWSPGSAPSHIIDGAT